MIASVRELLKSWGVMHWAVLLLVTALCVHKVYKRQVTRLQQASMENVTFLEKDIKDYNTMAEKLGLMEELPPVRSQWIYVEAIAKEFGVPVKREGTEGNGYYKGPLTSWDGGISGSTGAVLVAVKAFQQTVPTYLHTLTINGDTATVKFSVLGGN